VARPSAQVVAARGPRDTIAAMSIEHPRAIRPEEHAAWNPDKMGKATIFRSERILVGLNCFEPGQEHALHAHEGMDKVYHVLEGEGTFLLEGEELAMSAGTMLVAPEGVPHGIRNGGPGRLLVLAILSPAP
jgi:quercetin dioxygenase-like cupin family protein